MKRAILVTLVVCGFLLNNNAAAKADPLTPSEQQYVQALEADGIYNIGGDDSNLAQGGQRVCALLGAGWDSGQVMGIILQETMNRLTVDDARNVVNDATKYLCPGEASARSDST